jgi:hypothetical protein
MSITFICHFPALQGAVVQGESGLAFQVSLEWEEPDEPGNVRFQELVSHRTSFSDFHPNKNDWSLIVVGCVTARNVIGIAPT